MKQEQLLFRSISLVTFLILCQFALAQHKHWIGSWKTESSSVVMTFAKSEGQFKVKAVDGSDGEELQVSEVKAMKKVVEYTLFTPSTGFRVRCIAQLKGTNTFHERLVSNDTEGGEPLIYHKVN